LTEATEHAPRGGAMVATASLLGAVAIWGTFFPLVAILLRTWDPLPNSAVRLVTGAAVLVLVLVARHGFRALLGPLPWRRVLALSFVGIAGYNLTMTWGVAWSGPISASIVATAGPVIAALMQRAMYGTRLSRKVLLAATLAVAGGVCVALAGGGGLGDLRGGEILILAASATWLWYSMRMQDWFPGEAQERLTAVTYVVGSLGVSLAAILVGGLDLGPSRVDLSTNSLLLILGVGVSSTAIAVTLWLKGVARLGITVAAVWGNLVPFVTVLSSAALGIAPRPFEIVGGLVVIAGVVLVQRGGRKFA
jgi:drug/metabolite transporter (DMT)-like permease